MNDIGKYYLIMKIRKFKSIISLKDIWESIYNNNKCLSIYQSYWWNYSIELQIKSFINNIANKTIDKYSIEYYLFESNKHSLIAPLFISKKKKMIYILGQFHMSDYLSFIFDQTIEDEYIANCITYLRNEHINYKLQFCNIPEWNKKMLAACRFFSESERKEVCVTIPLSNNKIKHNNDTQRYIDQAYKRIKEDGIIISFNYANTVISKEEIHKLYLFCVKRRFVKFDITHTERVLHLLKIKLFRFLGYEADLLSIYSKFKPQLFLAKMKIDNKLAAYIIAEKKYNIYQVFRISINDNYSKYRPGIVLLENLKEYISRKEPSIKYLDFSRGNDKYKISFGGKCFYNHSFIFEAIHTILD